MSHPKIDITFSLDSPSRRVVDEAQIKKNFNAVREHIPSNDHLMGGITIRNSAGGNRIDIRDDLEFLIPKLCLESLPDLLAEKNVKFDLYSFGEDVALTCKGSSVVMSGNNIAPKEFARKDLLPGLVGCAERFGSFLKKFRGDNQKWESQIRDFNAAVKRARAQLKSL